MLISGNHKEIEKTATNWEIIFVTQSFGGSSLTSRIIKILQLYMLLIKLKHNTVSF